jgi:hypothetical protein
VTVHGRDARATLLLIKEKYRSAILRRAANHRRYRVLASAAIHRGCDVAALSE